MLEALRLERLTDQIGSHEGHGKLVVVLVVDFPQGVLLRIEVLPEPGKRDFTSFLVGVFALPVIENERWLGKSFQRVFGFRCRRSLLFFIILGFFGFWLGLCFGLLFLLLGCLFFLGRLVLDRFIDHLELINDGFVDGLVADRLIPSCDVRVLSAPLLIEQILEATR